MVIKVPHIPKKLKSVKAYPLIDTGDTECSGPSLEPLEPLAG